jgi:hypothetical protein
VSPRARRRISAPSIWLGAKRGYLTDWVTQLWVRIMGRKIRLSEYSWLVGPTGESHGIGAKFFDRLAAKEALTISRNEPDSGLIQFNDLDSRAFPSRKVHPRIAEFYEHTQRFDLSLWSIWRGIFRPFGWLISFLFARRLGQLNMPLDPIESAHGITSTIVRLRDRKSGAVRYTGWERRMARSNEVLYCGTYSVCTLPKLGMPCVKVVFPLPNGSATVILRPVLHRDGSMTLKSEGKDFGDAGFYFVVRRDAKTAWAFHLTTMKEYLHIYTDHQGVLRTDHNFRLWGIPFLSLHYRMTPRTD